MQPAREDEITIGDIAGAAGISVRTVSRVINSSPIADHLASLGHRSFGLINGPGRFHSAREREAGFRDGLARRGMSLDEQFVVKGDYWFASGRRCARLLLDRADRPTAIFAANDIMAAAVIKEAAARGLDVPRDVSAAPLSAAHAGAGAATADGTVRSMRYARRTRL